MTYDERIALQGDLNVAESLAEVLKKVRRWRNPAEYDIAEREILAAIERIAKQLGNPTT